MKRLSILAAVLAAFASPTVADVTLINVFEVPTGQRDDVVAAWQAARDFLSAEPGYISTTLHGSLRPDARFQLINVARWESVDAFNAATTRMAAAGVFPRIEGLGVNPALYNILWED